jgi:hypothetical protein
MAKTSTYLPQVLELSKFGLFLHEKIPAFYQQTKCQDLGAKNDPIGSVRKANEDCLQCSAACSILYTRDKEPFSAKFLKSCELLSRKQVD